MLSAARSVFWVNRADGSIGSPAEEAVLIRPGHQSVFPVADTLQAPWPNAGLPLALCLSLRQPKSTLELSFFVHFFFSCNFALCRSRLCSRRLFPAFCQLLLRILLMLHFNFLIPSFISSFLSPWAQLDIKGTPCVQNKMHVPEKRRHRKDPSNDDKWQFLSRNKQLTKQKEGLCAQDWFQCCVCTGTSS